MKVWRGLLGRMVCGLLAAAAAVAQAGTLALTFDDGFDPRTQPQAAQWNQAMLDALAAAGLKSMLFPAGRRVDTPEGLALVKAWSDAGHLIGNHTYAHRNYGSPRMSFADFTADVLAAEALFGALPGWTMRLRFPYLKEGDTADKRDRARDWLKLRGYRPGAVSIDTSDWYYAQRFEQWRDKHPQGDPARFREAYLNHLWGRANYYEALARHQLGRSPRHVMLLHTNAVNAQFLPDVIAMFQRKGWRIVSAAEAFEDPLYNRLPATVPAGESIVWALAREKRHKGLRYPAEDGKYEKPLLDGKDF
jgi:peptidoglycan/xylan/chitin deacetylase (PgdA/CDA1 family)